ncbi:MAG: hypothetical protein ACI8YP_001884, partial [Algoriphagus sp.]
FKIIAFRGDTNRSENVDFAHLRELYVVKKTIFILPQLHPFSK